MGGESYPHTMPLPFPFQPFNRTSVAKLLLDLKVDPRSSKNPTMFHDAIVLTSSHVVLPS